jgi:hypothetical protein
MTASHSKVSPAVSALPASTSTAPSTGIATIAREEARLIDFLSENEKDIGIEFRVALADSLCDTVQDDMRKREDQKMIPGRYSLEHLFFNPRRELLRAHDDSTSMQPLSREDFMRTLGAIVGSVEGVHSSITSVYERRSCDPVNTVQFVQWQRDYLLSVAIVLKAQREQYLKLIRAKMAAVQNTNPDLYREVSVCDHNPSLVPLERLKIFADRCTYAVPEFDAAKYYRATTPLTLSTPVMLVFKPEQLCFKKEKGGVVNLTTDGIYNLVEQLQRYQENRSYTIDCNNKKVECPDTLRGLPSFFQYKKTDKIFAAQYLIEMLLLSSRFTVSGTLDAHQGALRNGELGKIIRKFAKDHGFATVRDFLGAVQDRQRKNQTAENLSRRPAITIRGTG